MLGNLAKWYATMDFKGGRAFAMAATTVSIVYVVGFISLIYAPETKGQPLPEDKDFEETPVPETVGAR
jgi:hypothetical protein